MAYHLAAFLDLQHPRRRRIFRKRIDFLADYSDEEFCQRFRFSKANFTKICDLIREDLQHPTKRNRSLSPEMQLMCALRYLATGDKFRTIADTIGVHISTVSRSVTSVSEALTKHLQTFVFFPSDQNSIQQTKHGFFEIANFPGIVGCIDCTQVRIQAPTGDQEPHYVNRKGYHSINVQAICDWKGRFTNVVADWPGATHDSRILRCSRIGFELASGENSGLLLGDGGYACTKWLLTPVLFPRNEAEKKYNEAHAATRCIIERSFGVLKKRFGVLHCEIRLNPRKVCKVIGACFILHNMAISFDDCAHGEFDVANEESVISDNETVNAEVGSGLAFRRHFILQNFS